jgi:hypothetical protein
VKPTAIGMGFDDLREDYCRVLRERDAARAEVAALRERVQNREDYIGPLADRIRDTEERLARARELLGRVPSAEWMRDSCPYGCTGNRCPWCGAQQHVSEHEYGCLVPEARALLRGDEARPEHTPLCGVDCAWDCPIGGAQECERCRLVGICEVHARGRDEARGAPACDFDPCPHAPPCAAPTEGRCSFCGQDRSAHAADCVRIARAPEPPRCTCAERENPSGSPWRATGVTTHYEDCQARTGRGGGG